MIIYFALYGVFPEAIVAVYELKVLYGDWEEGRVVEEGSRHRTLTCRKQERHYRRLLLTSSLGRK